MRALLVFLLLCTATSAEAGRPTHAALRKAFEQNAGTVVHVSGGRRAGAGVIVGAGGQIATSTDFVGLYEAKVQVNGRELPAKVLSANAQLKIAVLSIEPDAPLRAPAVRTDAPLEKGTWLVGIIAGKKQPKPLAGQIVTARTLKSPFIVTDLPLPPGSPLFDVRGRLVAVVVDRVGRIGSRALPVGALKTQVAEAPAP